MINASYMRQEIEEIPEAVARFLDASRPVLAEAGAALRAQEPGDGRDHRPRLLRPRRDLPQIRDRAHRRASRSPRSAPRSCRSTATSSSSSSAPRSPSRSPARAPTSSRWRSRRRRNGALSFALTNTADSPLAAAADFTIDLAAGEEKSVAATKSFVSSVVAGLGLIAHWQNDAALIAALDDLPARPRDRRRLRLERARSPRSTATSRSTSSAAAPRWPSPTRRR